MPSLGRRRALLVVVGKLLLFLLTDAFVAPRCPSTRQQHARRRLLSAQASSSTSPPPAFQLSRSDAALEEFHAWLQAKGGLDLSASPIALRRIPSNENDPISSTSPSTNLGLFTTRSIEKDQILLAVPESLVLTSQLSSPALEALAETAELDHIGRLALRIVYEASGASGSSSSSPSSSSSSPSSEFEKGGWLPYLRVLPSRDDLDLPFLWEEEEEEKDMEENVEGEGRPKAGLLELLAPSPLYDDLMEVRAEMREELKSLRDACSKAIGTAISTATGTDRPLRGDDNQSSSLHHLLLPLLTWEFWTWARAIAMSRPYVLQQDAEAAKASSSSSSSSSSSRSSSISYPLLRLIPLVDMANHDDAIHYAVQPGDGIFTSRQDIQLVADRAYPHANTQFLSTYGALSSASKFYSFGYLDTLSPPSSSAKQEDGLLQTPPAQGTALLVLSLGSSSSTSSNEEEGRDEGQILSFQKRKEAVLASVGLKAHGQRVEISTRTSLDNTSGPTLAKVTIEQDESENSGGEGEEGGGVERLRCYLRLKHLSQEDLEALSSSSASSSSKKDLWTRLSLPLRQDDELAVALEVVSLCGQALQSVQDRLGRVCQRLMEGGREGGMERHRLGLLQTLLHGEMLALRAVAELFMEEVESMEEGERER